MICNKCRKFQKFLINVWFWTIDFKHKQRIEIICWASGALFPLHKSYSNFQDGWSLIQGSFWRKRQRNPRTLKKVGKMSISLFSSLWLDLFLTPTLTSNDISFFIPLDIFEVIIFDRGWTVVQTIKTFYIDYFSLELLRWGWGRHCQQSEKWSGWHPFPASRTYSRPHCEEYRFS